jgi:hypothetical protein
MAAFGGFLRSAQSNPGHPFRDCILNAPMTSWLSGRVSRCRVQRLYEIGYTDLVDRTIVSNAHGGGYSGSMAELDDRSLQTTAGSGDLAEA